MFAISTLMSALATPTYEQLEQKAKEQEEKTKSSTK
jgi:hypothetical protein